jgi:predicted transcriptional regulator
MERDRIVVSLRPQFARSILAGTKSIELRRVRPLIPHGTIAYLYATAPDYAVLGEMTLGKVYEDGVDSLWRRFKGRSGIDEATFRSYFQGSGTGCAIEIISAREWRQPLSLKELQNKVQFRPPQFYARVSPSSLLGNLLGANAALRARSIRP